MTHIRSRKHTLGASRSAGRPTGALTGATLVTGLAMLLPPAIAQAASANSAPATNESATLSPVQVRADELSRYKSESVSSPKFTQPLQDTPQTIQVITRELFHEQGAATLTEALRNSPGVGTFYVGENGNTATGDTVYMRGFDSSSSLFVDGVRDLGSISRDLFNIEQVEIAKGPAGTDNGRSAPTGSINLVSKEAFLEDAASASISVGSDSQKRVTGDWNQTLTLPGSALRLNLMYQDSDQPGRDQVSNQRWGIAPSLGLGLDSSTRLFLNLLYVEQDNVPDGGVPTIGLAGWTPQPGLEALRGHPVDSENFYGTSKDHDDIKAQMATVRIEHDFSDSLKLTNTTRWGRTQQDYLLTAFMGTTANIGFGDADDLSSYTLARSLPTFKDQENTIATNQLNLRADFATGSVQHNLSTGLEFTREELETRGQAATNDSTWPAANLYDPSWRVSGLTWSHNGADTNGTTTTESAYLFDTLKFGDSFLVTAGVRLDHYKTEFKSVGPCGGSGRRALPCGPDLAEGSIVTSIDDDVSDTLFNWKLGAVYKIGEISLYANYARSQQPPGGSSFELSASANSANNPIYDPQEAETYEIGSKWSLMDNRLALNLALFQTDVTNEIIADPVVPGEYEQNGKKRVKGVEISGVGQITDNWSISAGYTYMDTKIENGPAVTSDGSSGLPYTPREALTGWTTYQLPFGLTVGGGVRYSDAMHRGTDGAVGTPTFTRSYAVYDAMASYPLNDNLTVRLNVYNLTDKEYVAAINKSGYRYSPGIPRTFMLTTDFRF